MEYDEQVEVHLSKLNHMHLYELVLFDLIYRQAYRHGTTGAAVRLEVDRQEGQHDAQSDLGLTNTPLDQCVVLFLVAFMAVQVVWNYFDHQVLVDSGITIEGEPDQNVLFTTAGRLVAMIVVSLLVLVTQNPPQFVVVMLMSAVREAQEMFIDPFYPMADAPLSPAIDFGLHVVIVAIEVAALVVVYRLWRTQADNEVVEI